MTKYVTATLLYILIFFCISCNTTDKKESKVELPKTQTVEDTLSIQEKDSLHHIFDSTFTRLNKIRGFNGVVLGAKKGEIVFNEAYGYRDLRRRTKLHNDDIFQLASVSKQFTAASILLLEQDSLLSLSDTVNKFFPEFPYPGITIKMLLSHRSGLPNYIYLMEIYIKDKTTPINNKLCMDYMTEYKPGKYGSPDGRFRYSNSGYLVLASIVEKVSGQSFGDFLKNRIFDPLDMNRTFTFDTTKVHRDEVAIGHTSGRRKYEDFFLNGVLGDKSVYSTTEDLFKWHKALLEDSLLSEKSKSEAFKFQSPKRKGNFNYGFGWRLFKTSKDEIVVYHGGWWRGYSTLFVHYPSSDAFLIVLSNRVNHSFTNLDKVYDALEIPEFKRRN
ncbi:beta-lactamase family protein [Flammeovirga sp. MY04]|uniref:serine hydrolase domain-containing protein n=1 Tax=Flammeovirga sp. MY04 TaxID=1191459 RepID=UPI0008246AFF|nr:serine hydrolase domain-containing protein [Flammeovirga sp. MY04]ANQ48476.2 beta-lactamase family protein [Flammeovirga sp. MY04]